MPEALAAIPGATEALPSPSDGAGDTSTTPRRPLPFNRVLSMFHGGEDFYTAFSPDTAQTLRQRLTDLPDPAREQARIANTVFLADRMGLTPRQVAERYPTVMAAYAKQVFPDIDPTDELVFHGAVRDRLQQEAAEFELMGELNRQLFTAAIDGKDFKTAWESITAEGPGVIAKQRADVFNAWALERWEANRTQTAKLAPIVDAAAEYFAEERAGVNGEDAPGIEARALRRQYLVDQLAGLAEDQQGLVLALASERAGETPQAERGAFGKTMSAFVGGTADLIDDALLGLVRLADTDSRITGMGESRAAYKVATERRLSQVISGEVDPIKGDSFAGQVALDFTRSLPTMLAALTPTGVAVDFLALKQQARDRLEQQGTPGPQAEMIAAVQAIPQTALFFAQSKMVFLGKVPPGFGRNLGTTLATEYAGNLALNEAGFLTDAAIQQVSAQLSDAVPDVDWGQMVDDFKARLPHQLALAIPGALIGTGVARFKNPKAGQAFLQSPEVMEAAGIPEAAREAIAAAPDYPTTEAAFKAAWAERMAPAAPEPVTTVEPLGRRFLVAEGVGEPVAQFQVRRPGDDRGVTMTAEQLQAEGLPVPSDALTEIATVRGLDAAGFQAWSRTQKGGFTTTAHNLGRTLRSREEVNALLRAEAEANAQFEEVRAKAKAGDMDALNQAMILSTKGQFFREAYEAALGILSAGKRMRELDPDFAPPITRNPDGTYRVQATPDSPAAIASSPEAAVMLERAQRVEAEQQAATAAPEPHPERDGRPLPPRITALNKEAIQATRQLFNMDELPEPTRQRFIQVLDEAKRTEAPRSALETATDILATRRVASAQEHAALVLRSAELQNAYELKAGEIAEAWARGETERAGALKTVADNLLAELDTITEASDLSGTEIARALSIRRMRINRDDYSLARTVQRARTIKQGELTNEQQAQLKALTDDITEQQRIIAEQKNALAAQALELAKANAESFVAEGRARRRSAVAADAATRRAALKKELLALGMRVNDITSIIGLSVEQARIVAKIADTYVEEGIASLTELTNKLKADIPDLSEQDIYHAVGRLSTKQAKKIEAEAQRRVKELRTQAALWAKINAALDGRREDGSPLNRQQQHRLLRETLRELRRQAYRTTFDDAALKRVDAKIAEIQQQIATGERNLRAKPEKREPTEPLKQARAALKELRQELGALDTIEELEALIGEETAPAPGPGEPRPEPRPPTGQRLETLRQRIADLRDQIEQAQTDPAAINAERLAKIQRHMAEIEAQVEGGFRALREPTRQIPDTASVEAARRQLRELERLMRTEDSIADLSEQLRTGDFKVSAPEERILRNAKLERALIRERQLRRQVDESIEALRPKTLVGRGVEALLAVRALQTTADFGTLFRQLGILANPLRRPKLFGQTFVAGWKAMLSENTADAIQLAIENRPGFLDGVRAKLFLSDIGGPIAAREEHFMSRLAERIPGWGAVVRGSNRAMTVSLNMVRASVFDDFVRRHPESTPQQREAFAWYINASSGRGNMKLTPNQAKLMAAVFFAPRYAVSRFQTLYSPFRSWNDPTVRNEILKDFAAYVTTGTTVMLLAQLGGAEEVSLDPSESDFGKIVIDDTRIDMWGGLQQPARLLLQGALLPAQQAELVELERDIDPLEAATQFLKYKLSPAVTLPISLASGENVIGQEQGAGETVLRAVTPLTLQEAVDVGIENESIAAGLAGFGAGFFGLGVQQYERR